MIKRKDIQEWCRENNMPYSKRFGSEIMEEAKSAFEDDLHSLILDHFKDKGEWDLVDCLTGKEGGFYFR